MSAEARTKGQEAQCWWRSVGRGQQASEAGPESDLQPTGADDPSPSERAASAAMIAARWVAPPDVRAGWRRVAKVALSQAGRLQESSEG
jgi:hypothetical protein